MNRKERRRGKWMKFCPQGSFSEVRAHLGEDGLNLLVALFKSLTPGCPLNDEDIFNAVSELVARGFLNIWVRFDAGGVEIEPEFMFPDAKVGSAPRAIQ